MPAVVTNSPSALPCSTTFVSPVTRTTPARSHASAIAAATAPSTSRSSPSSRISAADRNNGRAPIIARSFTVPFTASSPMFEPGKNFGVTTNESVENASRVPFTSTTAASPSRASSAPPNTGTNTSRIRLAESLPPLP